MFLIIMKKRRERRGEEEDQTKERWREDERVRVRKRGRSKRKGRNDGRREEGRRRERATDKAEGGEVNIQEGRSLSSGESGGEELPCVLSLPAPTYTAAPQSHTRPLGQP